jgi:hypothetical protein
MKIPSFKPFDTFPNPWNKFAKSNARRERYFSDPKKVDIGIVEIVTAGKERKTPVSRCFMVVLCEKNNP